MCYHFTSMKFIKILILILFLFAFLPLDGFCAEHSDNSSHHHCIIVCHAGCHSAILPVSQSVVHSVVASFFVMCDIFPYQDPVLDTSKRPPVVPA